MAGPAVADPTIIELPLLPGTESGYAFDVNDSGVVVGNTADNQGRSTATLWGGDGRAVELTPLPGSAVNNATGINNHGVVVGNSGDKAVRWNPGGDVEVLDQPANTDSATAYHINDQGAAVGYAYRGNSILPVRWSGPTSTAEILQPLPNTRNVSVGDIDDAGVAVGTSGSRAVRWHVDGRVEALPVPADHYQSVASATNGRGDIVGYIWRHGASEADPVRWNIDGTVTQLPKSSPEVVPSEISDSGVVVGYASAPNYAAFQWGQDGSVSELPVLPAHSSSFVTGISDSGLAAGYASKAVSGWQPVLWKL